jgi:hypothetical protein
MQGCTPAALDGGGSPPVRMASLSCDNSAPHAHKCRVDIVKVCVFLSCQFVANVDEIHLLRSTAANPNNDIDIVWHLPDGYAFCSVVTSDGGVYIKGTNDGQFDGMYSTDDPNGVQTGNQDCKKRKHFHWNAKNTVPRPTAGYQYGVILYENSSGNRYSIDPWIYND